MGLLGWDASGLDLALIHAVGTPSGFAWRDTWWASRLLHDGGRLLGGLTLVALVVNIWRPWWDGPSRRERVIWVLITLARLLLVPALKRISATSCPWDLQAFGGVARYVSHWQFGMKDGGPGHCFPSGHAVAAFAFISGWFALRPHAPRAARWWLAGVLGLGLLFGRAQMAARRALRQPRPVVSLDLLDGVCAAQPAVQPAAGRASSCRIASMTAR